MVLIDRPLCSACRKLHLGNVRAALWECVCLVGKIKAETHSLEGRHEDIPSSQVHTVILFCLFVLNVADLRELQYSAMLTDQYGSRKNLTNHACVYIDFGYFKLFL